MDDALIVTIYVVIDDTMKTIGHRSHCLAGVSDAQVLTVAVLTALYFGNHRERAVSVLRGGDYFPHAISPSHFNRRLHALADWLELLTDTLGTLIAQAQAPIYDFVLDSLPLPVSQEGALLRMALAPGLHHGWCAGRLRPAPRALP